MTKFSLFFCVLALVSTPSFATEQSATQQLNAALKVITSSKPDLSNCGHGENLASFLCQANARHDNALAQKAALANKQADLQQIIASEPNQRTRERLQSQLDRKSAQLDKNIAMTAKTVAMIEKQQAAVAGAFSKSFSSTVLPSSSGSSQAAATSETKCSAGLKSVNGHCEAPRAGLSNTYKPAVAAH